MVNIGVLGPKGTFSDSAAQAYMKNSNTDFKSLYLPTIDEAVLALKDRCDFSVIPLENTLDGYVQRTIDLLYEKNVHIIDEIVIPIRFSLVANVTDISKIKKLYVQFKASGQCRGIIEKLRFAHIVSTESNMESFYKMDTVNTGIGAIIPYHIGRDLSFGIRIDDVTDSENNFTRFVIIKSGGFEDNIKNGTMFRAPIYIVPGTDRPGLLFHILSGFRENNINLVSIMSRPTRQKMGTYNFFIEIQSPYDKKEAVLRVLKEINTDYEIKVLGAYSIKNEGDKN